MNAGLSAATVKNELWSVVGQQVRRAELALLARAHSVVSVGSASRVLGVSAGDAAPLLLQHGWTAAGAEHFAAPASKSEAGTTGQSSDAAQLGQLSNYIVFLERKA